MTMPTLLATVIGMRRRYEPRYPTASPIAMPPTYETTNDHVTDSGVTCAAPAATLTAMPKITSAVPSLMRLSARSTVRVRSGRPAARLPTAVASVGASAAPMTRATAHGIPNQTPTPATANAVTTTSTVPLSRITRTISTALAQRRRDALPEQDRRQEQQQHGLRRQLDLPQRGDEARAARPR